jgi:WD40 repeat protein
MILLLREWLNLAHSRSVASSVTLVVLALVSPAAHDAVMQEPRDAPGANVARISLPPRALLRIGTADLRMSATVVVVAFSPDGRCVAAADANASGSRVVIFDVQTGRSVKQLVAPGNHGGCTVAVAYSPDGTKLLSGSSGGEIMLWDVAGDRLLLREKRDDGWVNAVAFSPDGSLIASASGDRIRLRRVAKPAEITREFTPRPDPGPGAIDGQTAPAAGIGAGGDIPGLAFTPDGTRLVAGTSADATIFIWRVRDGRLERTIASDRVRLWSESRNPRLNCVAVTPDGRQIMSVGQTTKLRGQTQFWYESGYVPMSEVRFWDIESGQRIADYHSDEDYGFGFGALSREGQLVAVADFGRLRILDAATGKLVRTIELPGSLGRRPAFSPDGTLVAMPIDNTVGLFAVSTGRRLHHGASTPVGSVVSAGWSSSGDRIVTGHGDGFVRVWDAVTGRIIWHKLLAPVISRRGWNARPSFVSFSRDGKLVVVAGDRDDPVTNETGIVAIYEAATGRTVREVPQKAVASAALAPDGRMLVVARSPRSSRELRLIGIEVATGKTRWATPPDHQPPWSVRIAGMRFESRPPWFNTVFRDGDVIRYNALNGHEQRRFVADWRTPEQQKVGRILQTDLWEATISADGRTLVSAGPEWLCVWDVESGSMRRKFPYPNEHGARVALAPDGRMLATTILQRVGEPAEDAIALSDVETGGQVFTLEPGEGRASVMVFSPDGAKLFTGLGRSSGIVWDVRSGQPTPRPNR